MKLSVFACMLGLALSGSAFAQTAALPAAHVGTVVAERRPIARSTAFVGRMQAVNLVNIRARVTGYLEAVLFTEGQQVADGAPLFRIEAGPFEAVAQQAEGEVQRAQGQYTNAAIQRQRADELVRTSAMSAATRDDRVAQEETAKGNLTSAQAALQSAKINLSYTEITAPITGRIGRALITKGNVVGPDSGMLTTIVSVDPMYVLFPVSQRDFLGLQKKGQQANVDELLVRLRYSDGSAYNEPGKINFIDVMVNTATDTVMVRATVPNPKGVLVDGQFMHVAVEQDTPMEKIVVPQAALIADQEGSYVLT